MQKADKLALLIADVFEAAGALRLHGDRIASAVAQSQARWQVLSVVSDGDWTVATAARRLGIARQSVQRIADLLVSEGLAKFEANPRHKGSPLLRLTDSGKEALAVITAASLAWREATASDIPDEYLTIAREVLRKLISGASVENAFSSSATAPRPSRR
jgi:DNA-binding MarR family transcriptional regulator